MDMKRKKKQPLFNHFDYTWNRNTLHFVYPTVYEDEARNCVAYLASFVAFEYGSRALRNFFVRDAALYALDSPWGEAKGCGISVTTKQVKAHLVECDNPLLL